MTLLQGSQICFQKLCINKFWKNEISPCRFVIDFCQLGFIGKMFKSVELPWLVQFFLMFYNDKPGEDFCTLKFWFLKFWWSGFSESIQDWSISSLKKTIIFRPILILPLWSLICFLSVDWLLENLIQTKVCKLETFHRKGKLFVSSRRCASWTRTTRSARRRRRSCGSTTSQVSSSTSAPTPRWRAR